MKITAITKGIPMEASFDTAVSYAASAGTLILGFAVAHNGLKLIKMENSALANAGVGVAALIGAGMVSNPFIQLGLIAVAGYSLTKAAVIATKIVAAPGASGLGGVTGFIAGLLPDSVKSKVNAFLPSFGEIGDYDNTNTGEVGDLDEPVGEINFNNEMNGNEDALLGNASSQLI